MGISSEFVMALDRKNVYDKSVFVDSHTDIHQDSNNMRIEELKINPPEINQFIDHFSYAEQNALLWQI